MEDLADQLEGLKDWLLWAQADTDDAATAIHKAALAVGTLGVAIRAAEPNIPRLYGPNTTALGLVTALSSELLADADTPSVAAVAELVNDRPRPRQPLGLLALLTNWAAQRHQRRPRARRRARPWWPLGADQWLALERGTRRWARRPDPATYAAYLRFASVVLRDPLERFAATGR